MLPPLSWHQEGSANVLGTDSYVLILGFLHYHQRRSAWMAALGNLFGKTNRNVFCIGSLAARMGLTALWPVNSNQGQAPFYRNTPASSLAQIYRL